MASRLIPDPVHPFDLDFAPMRKLRLGEEITQQQLATAAGINKMTLWRYEQGIITNPPIKSLIALSRALGVPMHSLFTITAKPRGDSE